MKAFPALAVCVLFTAPMVPMAAQSSVRTSTIANIRIDATQRISVANVYDGDVGLVRLRVARGKTIFEVLSFGEAAADWGSQVEKVASRIVQAGPQDSIETATAELGKIDEEYALLERTTVGSLERLSLHIEDGQGRKADVRLSRAQALALAMSLKQAGIEASSFTEANSTTDTLPSSPPTQRQPARSSPTIFTRCMAAAHVQTRAADEMNGPPSQVQAEAREANLVSICTSMPDLFLPELRK